MRRLLADTLVGLAVAVYGQISGVTNALGGSSVAIYALLTLEYAYFAFGDRRAV